jgi:hypothetical protein
LRNVAELVVQKQFGQLSARQINATKKLKTIQAMLHYEHQRLPLGKMQYGNVTMGRFHNSSSINIAAQDALQRTE